MALIQINTTDTQDDDIVGYVCHDPSAEEDDDGRRRDQSDEGCGREDELDSDGGDKWLGRRRSGGQQVDQEKDGPEEEEGADPSFPKVLFTSGSALETYETEGRNDDTNTALASHNETLAEETSSTDEEEGQQGQNSCCGR